MKKIIVSFVVITFLSFLSLGCDTTNSKTLIKKLEEKYHEEFQATKFGGRDLLSVNGRYYVYPKRNPEILFEAMLPDGELLDNYIDHVIYYDVQKKLEEGLKNKGIEAISCATIVDFNDYDRERNSKIITYNEYKEKYSFEDFFIKVAINEEDISDKKEDIQQVFLDVSKELDKKIVSSLYTFNSSNYLEVEKLFHDYVDPSDTEIKQRSSIKNYGLVVDKDSLIRFEEEKY